jgi:hypothetical protein
MAIFLFVRQSTNGSVIYKGQSVPRWLQGDTVITHYVVVLLGAGTLTQAEPFSVELKITGFRNVAPCAYRRRYCSSARFHETVQAHEVYVSIRKAPTEEYALDLNNA